VWIRFLDRDYRFAQFGIFRVCTFCRRISSKIWHFAVKTMQLAAAMNCDRPTDVAMASPVPPATSTAAAADNLRQVIKRNNSTASPRDPPARPADPSRRRWSVALASDRGLAARQLQVVEYRSKSATSICRGLSGGGSTLGPGGAQAPILWLVPPQI